MKIRHIFFDLDNTLWDHRKNAKITLTQIFEQEKIKEKYNLDFDVFYEKYFPFNEYLWELIRDDKIDKNYLRKHRFYDVFKHFGIDNLQLSQNIEHQFLTQILSHNELVPGALSLLQYLKEKGYLLHVLSNGFKEVTYKKIDNSGIHTYFETITSADELHLRKPNPKIYQYALDKSSAKKQDSMMIGDDWVADVEGALKFGMDAIFFDVFDDHSTNSNIKIVKNLSEVSQFI